MKKILLIIPLLIFSTTLLFPQSKVNINNLSDYGGKMFNENDDKPYTGLVFDLYRTTGNKSLEGRYKDGLRNGKWSWWNVDNKMDSSGIYKDGNQDRKWTYWYKGKKNWEATYKDGVRDGLWTSWHENGKKDYEGTYKDGKEDGLWTSWHENGKKSSEATYKDDVQNGKYTDWYENGQKFREGTFKDGKQDGLWTDWYENGQKSYEVTFKDGKEDGLWTWWFENGQKKVEGEYLNGERIKGWVYYTEDGLIIKNVCISTDFGIMILELYPEVAPKHVESFIQHVKNGYYNGTTFHRVMPGFMIQGGDPNSKDGDKSNDGQGGYAAKFYGLGDEEIDTSWMIPAEFNDRPHVTGALSMARTSDPNSAGSQFFICDAPVPRLNNQYTVFGQVISGLEVIEKIANSPRDKRNNPNNKIEMEIDFCEKIVEEEDWGDEDW